MLKKLVTIFLLYGNGHSCQWFQYCGRNARFVRYLRVIGDGDSSVIQPHVPIWGCMVKKIEYANHAIKCYRNRLEKIVQDFPRYKGKDCLTQKVMKRLAAGARCAIKLKM